MKSATVKISYEGWVIESKLKALDCSKMIGTE